MRAAIILVAFIAGLALAAAGAADRKKLLELIQQNPGFSDHYVDLGNTIAAGEKVTLLPTTLTREDAYLLAIQIDPKNAVAFNNLGVTLEDLEATVTLKDGTKMTKQELFLKAIEVDPKFGHAYNNLAETMQPDQKVNYPDGTSITRIEMFKKSIELDATYPYAFNNIGVLLADKNEDGTEQSVTLQSGDVLTSRKAFLMCIDLGNHAALHHCYKNLGTLLEEGEVIQLLGDAGDRVDKKECLRRSGMARRDQGLSEEEEEDERM